MVFNINSHLELLNQKMPRNLYQASCINSLYDASCTLNRESFAANGTAGSGIDLDRDQGVVRIAI